MVSSGTGGAVEKAAEPISPSSSPDQKPTSTLRFRGCFDSVAAMYEFASGVSGLLATVRATSFSLRVHVFGANGSAEVLGECELVLRKIGAEPQRLNFTPFDSQRAELEAFADAIEGRAPYPIPAEQMLATVAAFEATVASIESGASVTLE